MTDKKRKKKSGKKAAKAAGIAIACIVAVIIICARFVVPYIMYPLKYSEYVEKYSEEYDLEKELVYAVIRTESNFNSSAVSGKGALGLMQIMEDTADWIVDHSHIEAVQAEYSEPDTNIHMGCWYLNYLMNHFGDEDLALAAYNAGMGNVTGWLADERYSADGRTLKEIPFPETKEYVKRVELTEKIYEVLYFTD